MPHRSLPLPSLIVTEPVPGSSLLLYQDGVTRAQVLSAAWSDLNHVRRWIEGRGLAAVYVLAGYNGGVFTIRIGEGARLVNRLPDHRANPALDFVSDIYVLASESFTKAAVVRLQERLTDLAVSDGRVKLVAGCGPLRGFPLPQHESEALDLALHYALPKLHAAGCRAFSPLLLEGAKPSAHPRR